MRSLTAGPVRLAFLIAAMAIAAPALQAQPAPPDPAVATKLHVDSAEINLTAQPSFAIAVTVPTVLKFASFDYNGQHLLHVWVISRADSLQARIRKATSYLERQASIFTPLIEPPNRQRSERTLRDLLPERRLSYNWRLT